MPALSGDSNDATPGVSAANTGPGPGVFARATNGEGVHGETSSTNFAAVTGISNNAALVDGFSPAGVFGRSQAGEGVHGETNSTKFAAVAGISNNAALVDGFSPAGVFGRSQAGEGVHGETNSTKFAAVAGISNNAALVDGFSPAGVFGRSQAGEGVHGETNSTKFAAVAGISNNAQSTGAGVFCESHGQGPGMFARGTTAGFFEGNVVVTGDVTLPGADYAEDFDVTGNPEPGTVVVIEDSGSVRPSDRPYDSRVAGVVAGAGEMRPALILDRQPGGAARSPLALMGKVCCKADASYAPIAVGDLLTTSATPGHAMKAVDRELAFGSIIGKALRSLDTGCGLLPILVALQ